MPGTVKRATWSYDKVVLLDSRTLFIELRYVCTTVRCAPLTMYHRALVCIISQIHVQRYNSTVVDELYLLFIDRR